MANFTYSRRSKALFAQGKEALLHLRGEKEKLAARLQEVSTQADLSVKMMEMANDSMRKSREQRKAFAEETSKLREELEKEREAHAETKIRLELELAQAKAQQSEAWEALTEERQAREESTLLEKAVFEAALEEERDLRGVDDTRIQVLKGELKEARGELSQTKADLNGARARIRSAVADFKNSPTFDNLIELRRRHWLADFHQSEGYRNEIKFATLDGVNRVLDRLQVLHLEWNFFEEIRCEMPRPPQQPPAQPPP